MLHLKYRPDIDGLRAIAVLSVVLFHAFPDLLTGGFVGVDIFFVISGYLITAIILGSLDAGSFSFLEFFARRVRRIFPELLIVLLACLAAGWAVMLTSEYATLGKHTAAAAAFIENFALWREGGYFDSDAHAKPLLHVWSLGLEEQFYLAWPLVLWLTRKTPRLSIGVTLAIALISLACSIVITPAHHVAAFYAPVTRFWELMAGALLACFSVRRIHPALPYSTWLSGVGLLLITCSVLRFDSATVFPGAWAMLPVLGAVLVIAAGPQAWVNRMALSHRWAVFAGKISYPLYLWHWPLLVFALILHNGTPPLSWRVLCVAASVVLAVLTYVFLEKRVRFRRDRQSLATLVVLNIVVAALGVVCWLGMIPPRHNEKTLELVITALEDQMRVPVSFREAHAGKQLIYSAGNGRQKTLFIGDSHMEQYEPRIEQLVSGKHAGNAAIIVTHPSCPAFSIGAYKAECDDMRSAIAEVLTRKDVDTVVVGGHWIAYAQDPIGYAQFSRKLAAYIKPLIATKRVFLLLDNPYGAVFDPHNLIQGPRWGKVQYQAAERRSALPAQERQLRNVMLAVAANTGAQVLDPAGALCRDGQCQVTLKDGRPIYLDTHHLRPFYVRQYAGFLDAALASRALHKN